MLFYILYIILYILYMILYILCIFGLYFIYFGPNSIKISYFTAFSLSIPSLLSPNRGAYCILLHSGPRKCDSPGPGDRSEGFARTGYFILGRDGFGGLLGWMGGLITMLRVLLTHL